MDLFETCTTHIDITRGLRARLLALPMAVFEGDLDARIVILSRFMLNIMRAVDNCDKGHCKLILYDARHRPVRTMLSHVVMREPERLNDNLVYVAAVIPKDLTEDYGLEEDLPPLQEYVAHLLWLGESLCSHLYHGGYLLRIFKPAMTVKNKVPLSYFVNLGLLPQKLEANMDKPK